MKKIAGIILPILVSFYFISCSSSSETVKEENTSKDSVYVFDKFPEDNTEQTTVPEVTGTYYIVQIGAFTTKDKADTFTGIYKQKFNDEISVTFDNLKNLYLVQLVNKFTTKPEAETKRDLIKKNKEFSDVWIVTINK